MRNRTAALKRELDRRWFARAVERVVASLSDELHLSMDNLHIVVEAEPPEALSSGPDDQLFGFYEGVPLTERTGGYGLVLPDRIMIYQGPLERAFPDSADLYEQIRITVLHEIAHHFGIDEPRLAELGYD